MNSLQYKKKSGVMRCVLTSIATFFLTACASDTPYLDSKFGQALERGIAAQTLNQNNNRAEVPIGARELQKGMDNYLTDKPTAASIQGVSVGGASGR